MRRTRACYEHLGGRLAAAITERLAQDGDLLLGEEQGELTTAGQRALALFGIDVDPTRTASAASFCRPCLDWSELRFLMAGWRASFAATAWSAVGCCGARIRVCWTSARAGKRCCRAGWA